VPFIDLFLIVWRRWRRRVPFYSPGADHVHHDLVLVHGFSQRKSVLLLYSWCLLLNALAVAMQQHWGWATIVLGILAIVATSYMARLLSRYRSRHLADVEAPTLLPAEALETGEVLDLPAPAPPDAGVVSPASDFPSSGEDHGSTLGRERV